MRWKLSYLFLMIGFILIIIDAIDYITGYSILQIETYTLGIVLIAIGFILGIGYKREY
ncbi:MAG: hypothetical protein R6U44_06835 [Archaeoglobaceae archaeon]